MSMFDSWCFSSSCAESVALHHWATRMRKSGSKTTLGADSAAEVAEPSPGQVPNRVMERALVERRVFMEILWEKVNQPHRIHV